MARTLKARFLLVFVLLGSYHCQSFIKKPKNRITLGYVTWKFYLQPFQGVELYSDHKPIRFQKISHDKTRGLLQIKAPVYKDQSGFLWEVHKKGFRSIRKNVFLRGRHKNWLNSAQTFVLDAVGSRHRFHSQQKVGRQPKSITFVNNREVAVPLLYDQGIDIVHIEKHEKKRIAPPAKDARLGGFVESLVLKKQNELWVSQMSNNALHVFDLEHLKYKKLVKLSGVWVKMMVYHKQRKRIYASHWLSKDISVVDPIQYKEIKKIHLGGVPRGLWLNPRNDELFIAEFGSGNDTDERGRLIKLDLVSERILARTGPPGSKRHIVHSRYTKKLYVSDMKKSKIEVYETLKGRHLKSIQVGPKPNTIVLDPSHRYLYVSCRGPNSPLGYLKKGNVFGRVDVIDLRKHEVVESIEGGNQPTGLDISPDGRYLVFSNFLDHEIRIYQRLFDD